MSRAAGLRSGRCRLGGHWLSWPAGRNRGNRRSQTSRRSRGSRDSGWAVVIRRWFGLLVAQAIVRVATRLAVLVILLIVAMAAAPVTAVAAGAFTAAWWRGLRPRRLLVAAAWCGPMVAVWLGLVASRASDPVSVATAPYHAWLAFWRLAGAGAVARAVASVARRRFRLDCSRAPRAGLTGFGR